MRDFIFRKLLPWTLAGGFVLCFTFPLVGIEDSFAARTHKRNTVNKKALMKRLFQLSGLENEKRILAQQKIGPEAFTDPKLMKSLGLSTEFIEVTNSVYKGTFQANKFYNTMFREMLRRHNGRHLNKSIKFFRTRLGRKVARYQNQFLKQLGKYHEFVENLSRNRPSSTRLALVDRFEKASNLTDYMMDVNASIFRTLAPLNQHFNAPEAEKLITRMNVEMRDQRRSMILIMDLFIFRSLKNNELRKLVRFMESDAGQWFARVGNESSLAAVKAMNHNATRRLNSLMALMETGQQDFESIKSIFSPGLRYMFSNERDPFDPLVVEDAEKKKQKIRKASLDPNATDSHEPRFGKELESLEAIPYELYRRLKQVDPALYSDLDYYGALFKNRKELSRMAKSDYMDEVNNYKKLIKKAMDYAERLVQTPLQTELKDLKLSGVLWDGFGTIALVETPDSHGHTVKVGSLVGPNYGVVETIDQEKMVIVERIRDFQGNIFSVTQLLEFAQPDE
jgi:Tfp pilus assembly protein PilP